MENARHEAIKAAYGEHWKDVQLVIDENGWFDMAYSEQVPNFDHLWDASDKKNAKIRPKSLNGIERNNGWTRVEDGLPKEYKNYWCRTYNGDIKILRFDPEFKEWYYECNTGLSFTVTHYQPIETPKPPIF
ncbi:hypothetical protein HZP39_04220 [Elizabethkingia anophelis]|nr:hypothetical protein [Elizabethkingia anophelis]MCT4239430.1 hypothetical protein [Elizabethkingia anophelis]MCT4281999.1 hypothetical protein [Elizabethkingia anophelis]MCT4292584.1 hypothetical protein [Elizabethkingia anophelis]